MLHESLGARWRSRGDERRKKPSRFGSVFNGAKAAFIRSCKEEHILESHPEDRICTYRRISFSDGEASGFQSLEIPKGAEKCSSQLDVFQANLFKIGCGHEGWIHIQRVIAIA